MKIKESDQLTVSQAVVILISYTLAAGILTLPRTAASEIQTPDVWITVLLGGFVVMIVGVIIVKLGYPFPNETFFQFIQRLVGKWVGTILGLLVIVYFVLLASFEIRTLTEVTTQYLLDGTPNWAIIMPFMWISLYLITSGLNSIARLFEIIFPITFTIFLLVILLSLGVFEIDNLRPVLGSGLMAPLKGLKTTILTYLGVEVMLIVMAFMQKPNKAIKVVIYGTAISTFFYLITVVMVIGALSVDGVITKVWPTIWLIQSFEVPGLVFERFESFLLAIWIMQIFATFTITYYFASLGLSQILLKDIRKFMFGLIPIIYIIAMVPKDVNELFAFGDWIGNMAMVLFGVLPVLLLFILKLTRGRHVVKNK